MASHDEYDQDAGLLEIKYNVSSPNGIHGYLRFIVLAKNWGELAEPGDKVRKP